jgi:hypothetical protein
MGIIPKRRKMNNSSRDEACEKNSRLHLDIIKREFENRLLRRLFVSERDEATGEWRKLHNEELNDL